MDESASDEDVVVVFDSSSEEDSDDVFTGSDSEEEESSDDTMASTHEWYRIDPDSIPARPPRFEFKGSPGVTITVSSHPQPLELFEAYFDDELIDVIVVETNCAAAMVSAAAGVFALTEAARVKELSPVHGGYRE
ncbi:hypothetical protein HPB49_011466 [Dermacentor silvarum]|uniref:Uncharacterized protein n=1 Tax=Dermacentor silvarum TaxID=543639 RepID=A0ACB8CR41_DERSI|nr:hypothetical protein HPB49_011466 [Dermacentor silvarum]